MPDPDPDQTSTITVPASASAPVSTPAPAPAPAPARMTEPVDAPAVRNGSQAVIPPGPPARSRSVTAVDSRFVIIHPHVSFFSWLADKQGPPDAAPEERLDRYRRDSPWLFRVCVLLDLLLLFVVSGILVVALAVILFKAIFGVI